MNKNKQTRNTSSFKGYLSGAQTKRTNKHKHHESKNRLIFERINKKKLSARRSSILRESDESLVDVELTWRKAKSKNKITFFFFLNESNVISDIGD